MRRSFHKQIDGHIPLAIQLLHRHEHVLHPIDAFCERAARRQEIRVAELAAPQIDRHLPCAEEGDRGVDPAFLDPGFSLGLFIELFGPGAHGLDDEAVEAGFDPVLEAVGVPLLLVEVLSVG